METNILPHTLVLTCKLVGKLKMPDLGHTNITTANAIVEILKYAKPDILFVGIEPQDLPAHHPTEDELLFQIHVIDGKLPTNCNNSVAILRWFSRQVNSNRERIVIKNVVASEDFCVTTVDIYVREINRKANNTVVRHIYESPKHLDHAV